MHKLYISSVLACLLFVAGCDQETMVTAQPKPPPPPPEDPLGTAYPARVVPDGQMAIEGTFEGKNAWFALDTGASPTVIGASLKMAAGTNMGTMAFGPMMATQTFYTVNLAEADAFVGITLGALVGSDVLALKHDIVFDYARSVLYFLDETPKVAPLGTVNAPSQWAFTPVKGIPVVSGDVDKAGPVQFTADTGSGVTIIPKSIWDKIQDGSLPELHGYVWKTLSADVPGFVVRLPKVTLGDPAVTIAGSWAIVVPDDNPITTFLVANGLPASFLGYPIYRRFVLGYSSPDNRFTSWPLEILAEPENEWNRVGFDVATRAEGCRVEWIYTGTDAEKVGVQKNDILTSIDGAAPKDLTDCRNLLKGTPGQTRTLDIMRAGASVSLTVKVEDLLPELP